MTQMETLMQAIVIPCPQLPIPTPRQTLSAHHHVPTRGLETTTVMTKTRPLAARTALTFTTRMESLMQAIATPPPQQWNRLLHRNLHRNRLCLHLQQTLTALHCVHKTGLVMATAMM